MKKNVASQIIGAQMVSASDGSAFTGAVTCYVTGDGGTQAAGSVGSGACTHEGNGFHTYAPSQGETNYDHIAFTFTGSGAVPVTVQVFTGFPQTGDTYARAGAPAGASLAADIAAVKGDTAAILLDTGTDGVVVAAGSKSGYTISGTITTLDGLNDLDAAGVRAAVGLASANLDTQLADIPTVSELNARTLAAADYFDPATDTVANVTTVATVSALGAQAKADVNAEVDTALGDYDGLVAADLPANFSALGINASGHISRVTLVDTTTANTDMRGTDGAYTGTPPTVGEIADGVWDELQSGHVGAGTFGAYLDASVSGVSTGGVSAADIADAVWDEALSGHATAGSAGEALTTAAAGGGGGLDAAGVRAAIGLASANLDTQLADLPTVAEFNARTKLAADYFDHTTDSVFVGFLDLTAQADVRGAIGLADAHLDNRLDTLPQTIASGLALAHGSGSWETATGFSTLDAAGVRSALGMAAANLDTQLDALPTAAENAAAILATPANKLATGVDGSVTATADVDETAIANAIIAELDFADDIAAIKAKTDQLGTATIDVTNNAGVTEGGDILIKRFTAWSASLTLGSLAAYSKLYLTIKENPENDTDAEAVVQIDTETGLLILEGAAGIAGDGSFTINDANTGEITMALLEGATSLLSSHENVRYDIKGVRSADGRTVVLVEGRADIETPVTRQTS